jgi:beta-N-acetylhexosaminidase
MEQNNQEQQERREARRRRRVRNQVMAYITVIVFIAAMAAGIVFGVQYLTGASREKEQEKQEQVDQMLGTEESIAEPENGSEEIVEELTSQQKLDAIVDAGIEVMPLEDKVAGLFIVTPESITGVSAAVKAGDGTKDALTQYAVGGIVYSARNIQSESQFKEMIDNTKLYANYPLFVAVEDEGGNNSPLAEKGLVTKQDGAVTIGETGDANQAYQAGSAIGTYLSEYGFNLNFAPVADITSVDNSIMASRAYGSEADKVSTFVTSMVQGLKEQNVNTCLKYFPGTGSTTQDTEEGLASTDRSAEDFRANEFVVFQAGIEAGADMVMVSHMSAPALAGDNTPCSMSSAVVTDILRKELGFDGVIITDAMNKKAVSDYYSADEAAVLALRAGCDMILMPEDFEQAYNGVLEAVQSGVISEERINDSLRRIYRIKYADRVEE